MKTLREYVDQLDEISRRDFLKGAGATAGLAATDAIAAPWQARTTTDQMTDKKSKDLSVESDDKRAFLKFWPDSNSAAFALIEKKVLQSGTNGIIYGAIRFGSSPPESLLLKEDRNGKYYVGWFYHNEVAKKIMNFTGKLLIQVPIYTKGNEVYKFTIEPMKEQSLEESEPSNDAVARIEELTKYK